MADNHMSSPENLYSKHKINAEDIKGEAEKYLNIEDGYSENLRIVLNTQEKLKHAKATDIRFADPLLRQGDNAVIFPHTINVIQGQAGVHKSRLAENICSSLLKTPSCNNEFLGFNKLNGLNYCVLYVDTERNLTEQLPYALQSIQIKAGYSKTDHPGSFDYISLLEVQRKDRYETLNDYLIYLRTKTKQPLFIVLDVSTDCIEDFNKTDKSMQLIDLMNITINQHNAVFLCLIHENPKSDKARGHFGTELMNKASTVMQVNFEKDANQNDTEIISVKYLKCRSTKKHSPFYLKYCNVVKGLVLANSSEISELVNNRKYKAGNEDIIELIKIYLEDGSAMQRPELIENLCQQFKAKERTIETRLKEIVNSEMVIMNLDGKPYKLNKYTCDKKVFYNLIAK